MVLHLVRVFLTGAYKNGVGQGQRREWNWVIGVVMLLLTLFLSFTGYLLPWDQLAFWAVTVGTNIAAPVPVRGPGDPGAADRRPDHRPGDADPLLRPARHRAAGRARGARRVSHVAHPQGRRPRVGRRRRARVASSRETASLSRRRPTRCSASPAARRRPSPPDLREAAGHDGERGRPTSRGAPLSSCSAPSRSSASSPCSFRSPLEEPANALVTPNPAKAPWYFLWLQEIVTDTTIRIGSFTINGAFLGGVILPGLLVTLLTVWPWLDRAPAAAAGVWFPASRRRQNLVFLGS